VSSKNPQAPVKLVRKRLDHAAVEAHLAALRRGAQALEVRIKSAVAVNSEATRDELDEIVRRLREGQIVAIQIRFFQDDAWWCDTIVRKGDDYRLVHMRQEDPSEP
jgi:hypothetical protein